MEELMDKLMDELMDDLAMCILLFGQKKMAKTHTFDDAIAKRMSFGGEPAGAHVYTMYFAGVVHDCSW